MTFNPPPFPPAQRKSHIGLWISLVCALAVVLCFGGLFAAGLAGQPMPSSTVTGDPYPLAELPSDTPAPSSSTSSTAPKAPAKAAPERPAIGEGVWHIGDDVPAGTYRALTEIPEGGLCYWARTSDDMGTKIIANGIPTGGRPQVTLRAGEWFTSTGCPIWSKR